MKNLIALLTLIPLAGCSSFAETYSSVQPFPSNGGIVSEGSSASAMVVYDPEKSKKYVLVGAQIHHSQPRKVGI
jgi:hypothetical protein